MKGRRAASDDDVNLLISEGEGYKVEYKEKLAGLDKEMVAFSNASGGTIYLGISDTGEKKDFRLTNKTHSRIMDIGRNCDPPIIPRIRELSKGIVEVVIPPGDMKPYRCSSGFYTRMGPNSQKLKTREIVDMVLSAGSHLFGEATNTDFSYPDDFSLEGFKRFCRLCGIPVPDDPVPVLRNLGLVEEREGTVFFNNAGVLFLSREPTRFFRHAELTGVRFKGTDRVKILDRKDFRDDPFTILENAVLFVKRNTRLEYRIESLKREELPEYPDDVIREAVINAIIHRNYLEKSMVIQLNIFDDRIEIVNPGGLIKGMKVEDLGSLSYHRNPLTADLFYRAGMIEKIGSGIRRMRESMEKAGGKVPGFSSTELYFRVVIRSLLYGDSVLTESDNVEVIKSDKAVTRTDTDRILELCVRPRTTREILSAVGMKHRAYFLKHTLHPLIETGLIGREYPDKPRSPKQRYRTTEKGLLYLKERERVMHE